MCEINVNDLRIETFREQGYDGINKTNKAGVRIMHIPSGLKVENINSNTQTKNKELCIEQLKDLLR